MRAVGFVRIARFAVCAVCALLHLCSIALSCLISFPLAYVADIIRGNSKTPTTLAVNVNAATVRV